jgi:50S ribosomal protein L16 3-hydroxylase
MTNVDRAKSQRTSAAARTLFGGRTPSAFLHEFWHKKALLVRGAMADFTDPLSLRDLQTLAQRDDVESRLVVRNGRSWSLAHGPFRRADFKALPARNWTLLVQGVNLHVPAADALMRRFAFVPYARLDDVMVSYAAPGGGVGPHFDSYDVFLLQGGGRRRWRYGRQADLSLRPRLPVKILAHFVPRHEAVTERGDLLYLPPHYAHDGVAIESCTTYSIGFRAAAATELATAFLDHLRDQIDLPGRYADPDLEEAVEPARIGASMQRRYAQLIERIRWDRSTVARFLGCWLSEPKPSVFFTPSGEPASMTTFARAARAGGIRLDARTLLLYDDAHVYINGIAARWPEKDRATLERLANERALSGRNVGALARSTLKLLHDWYRNGYVHTGATR